MYINYVYLFVAVFIIYIINRYFYWNKLFYTTIIGDQLYNYRPICETTETKYHLEKPTSVVNTHTY